MNATTTTGHHPHVQKSATSRVILRLKATAGASYEGVLVQTCYATTEYWYGLTWSDANDLVEASESSTIGQTTRNYLGTVKLTIGAGTADIWQSVSDAWGTRVQSSCQRMGNTNLYQVTKTTEVLDVIHRGDGVMTIS